MTASRQPLGEVGSDRRRAQVEVEGRWGSCTPVPSLTGGAVRDEDRDPRRRRGK